MSGISGQDATDDQDNSKVVIYDSDGSGVGASVELQNGKKRLLTDTLVTAQVTQGRDPFPDSWFEINNTGASGDTIRIQIAATGNDPSSPDRDLPIFDKTFTTLLAEVGYEVTLAKRIISEIKADAGAALSEISAILVKDDENAVVFVTSKKEGTFFERPLVNDFQVTTTGTAAITLGFNNFLSRQKESELARSKTDPRRGILGISGSVTSAAEAIDKLLEEFASNGGVVDLAVNPGGTPDVYTINANATGGDNKIISAFKLYGTDTNIKVGEDNFLGLNSPLTNGLMIEITKGGVTSVFRNLKTTNDFLSRMASSPEKSKIIGASSGDYIISIFDFADRNLQLELTAGTTDKIEVTVEDNISSIDDLFFIIEGFLEES